MDENPNRITIILQNFHNWAALKNSSLRELDKLPHQIKRRLINFLDMEDVYNCSLVSKIWRDRINQCEFWKRRCINQTNTQNLRFLRRAPSKVDPIFELPEIKGVKLKPLCTWRVIYMKLIHLKCNWFQNRFGVCVITIVDSEFQPEDVKIDVHRILTPLSYDLTDEFNIWNVQHMASRLQTITGDLIEFPIEQLYLRGKTLVFLQDQLLQSYRFHTSSGGFNVRFRCVFNMEEDESKDIPTEGIERDVDIWYITKLDIDRDDTNRQLFIDSCNVGTFFIGYAVKDFKKSFELHVWDTKAGKKLKTQLLTLGTIYEINSFKFLTCHKNNKFFIFHIEIVRNTKEGYVTHVDIFNYDLKTLSYKKIMSFTDLNPHIYFEQNFVVTVHGRKGKTKLNIYDAIDGKHLIFRNYDYEIVDGSIKIHEDNIGMCLGKELTVSKISVQKVPVFSMPLLNNKGAQYQFLDWNLILIQPKRSKNQFIEVWEMKKHIYLYSIEMCGQMFLSKNISKLFLWRKSNNGDHAIDMLQFW